MNTLEIFQSPGKLTGEYHEHPPILPLDLPAVNIVADFLGEGLSICNTERRGVSEVMPVPDCTLDPASISKAQALSSHWAPGVSTPVMRSDLSFPPVPVVSTGLRLSSTST